MQSNRREFLKTSTAAVAAAGTISIVSPHQVRGSAANSRLKIGCVGMGGRGRAVANAFAKRSDVEIYAVADYFPNIAKGNAEHFGVPAERTFSGLSGYQKVLDTKPDAINVINVPYFYPEQVEAAVNAGVHVYMAKPIAVDVPGCLKIRTLAQEASKKNQVVFVDVQWRYLPYLVECIQHVKDGKISPLKLLQGFYYDEGREDHKVEKDVSELFIHLRSAMSRELSGDRMVSAGIHTIDTALHVLGTLPTRASGVARRSRANPVNSATDSYSVTFEFPDGVFMNYTGDQFRNYSFEVEPSFAGLVAYADQGYLRTYYGKGVTCMRSGDWRYEGGENPDLYPWGIQYNADLFCRIVREQDFSNEIALSVVNSNLACLLGANAGRMEGTLTWDELLKSDEKMEVDLTGLVQ